MGNYFDAGQTLDDFQTQYKRVLGRRVQYVSRMMMPELEHSFSTDQWKDYQNRMVIELQLNLAAFDGHEEVFDYSVPATWRDQIKSGLLQRFPKLRRWLAVELRTKSHRYTVYEKICPHLGMHVKERDCMEWASCGDANYEVRYTWEEWLELFWTQQTRQAAVEEEREYRRRQALTNSELADEDERGGNR